MKRKEYYNKIKQYFRTHPIVSILGPRQCGKTILARQYTKDNPDKVTVFDLERPQDIARLQNPELALRDLEGLIVIDEIQRIPELFPVLRTLVDRENNNQKYLILGSASRDLIRQSSETLAGRIAHMELTPFYYRETQEINNLWIRGGFPRSYLAETEEDSVIWRSQYIDHFLERDIPLLGFNIPAQTMRKLWMMLVHYHGNILNSSELGRSLGMANTTIRKYIDILSGTFMIRELQPWFENIGKRQVKSSKVYFRDSGILHSLANIENMESLQTNPKIGASWEGFALEEVIRHNQIANKNCYFWATHNGAELDLLIKNGQQNFGFEFKYTDSPSKTKSMSIAIETLGIDKIYVIYPGEYEFQLSENIIAIGLETYLNLPTSRDTLRT